MCILHPCDIDRYSSYTVTDTDSILGDVMSRDVHNAFGIGVSSLEEGLEGWVRGFAMACHRLYHLVISCLTHYITLRSLKLSLVSLTHYRAQPSLCCIINLVNHAEKFGRVINCSRRANLGECGREQLLPQNGQAYLVNLRRRHCCRNYKTIVLPCKQYCKLFLDMLDEQINWISA